MKNTTAVVYIITKLELGGAQKVCLALFEGISSDDYQTHLITSSLGELVPRVQDNPRAHLTATMHREVSLWGLVREVKNVLQVIKQLRALKAEYRAVIVHTHSTKAGIVGRWAARCAGITQIVHTVHGFSFHQFQSTLSWLLRYLPELITSWVTTKFIFVSHADARLAARILPMRAHKHVIIRAAVDDRHFIAATKETPIDKAAPYRIGTISCFKPQKNLIDLLKAFEMAYHQDDRLRLEIIGDGQQRPSLEAFIEHHRLKDVVTLHGWQHDVAPIMKRWHLFALSSLWEGLPCALIEARLLRLPVISYRIGGIGDIIHHGVNGLLYDAQEWKQLAQGIVTLVNDSTLYAQLSHYPDDLHHFTRGDMLKKHRELYQQL